jgi:hypothetical protein
MARMLRSLLVGLFVEHVAGVLEGTPGAPDGTADTTDNTDNIDTSATFRLRADEVAAILERRVPDDGVS